MSSSPEDFVREIANLLVVAKSALKINMSDVESFLTAVSSYLDQFESLKNKLEMELSGANVSLSRNKELAKSLSGLQKFHDEIVNRAESSKDMVADVIADVHKRSHALKKYVDGFPDRISITKKKEG